MTRRKLVSVVRGIQAVDGAGVHLRRVLGKPTIEDFDPFLMLDGFDSTNPEDYIKGFPWHPHRGIETVTYLLSGSIEHGDSLGNKGVIGKHQCQWMTAGSGIIHQEMPQASDLMLGCQLWVNLPRQDKMTEPVYRDIKAEDVSVVKEDNATIRVLSGTYKGQNGAVKGEYVPVQYLDVELTPNTEWTYNQTPNEETLFLYLITGTLAANAELDNFENKACALLLQSEGNAGEANNCVTVKAGPEGARFFLLAATPLKQPVAWGGPIVMNTKDELQNAFAELENNTFIKHKHPREL